MGVEGALLGRIGAASVFGSRQFLGPGRVRLGASAKSDLDWWPQAKDDAGAGLRVRLLQVRDAANEAAASSMSPATDPRNAVTVSSSRSSRVSAEAVAGATRIGSASFQVKVTNVAIAQVNEGLALTAASVNGIQAGTNQFTITVGTNAATTVTFTNDSTDTYAEVLEKLATAINETDAGATASVVEDDDAGTVQLVLTADATGRSKAFTVADVSGDVVSTVGFGSTTTSAENAGFFVDGAPATSGSNTVLIDHGRVQLTLNAATGPAGDDDESGAVISVKPDALSEAIVKLTGLLNALRGSGGNEASGQARRILDGFDALLASRRPDLESIGITIDADHQLNVNGDRLGTAIESHRATVGRLLGGAGGLGTKLAATATQALVASRVRAQRDDLVRSDGLPLGSSLVVPHRGSSRGALVDVFG